MLRGSLHVVGAGVVLGILVSLAAARAFSGLLFDVPPHDPVVLGGTILVLGATAVLASYRPAARAASLDPITTLRAD